MVLAPGDAAMILGELTSSRGKSQKINKITSGLLFYLFPQDHIQMLCSLGSDLCDGGEVTFTSEISTGSVRLKSGGWGCQWLQ